MGDKNLAHFCEWGLWHPCRERSSHKIEGKGQEQGWQGQRPDAKSKGGAAAASADDGDVAAVMEVDDVVMRTGDDETSTGWCFALTSMCAVVG